MSRTGPEHPPARLPFLGRLALALLTCGAFAALGGAARAQASPITTCGQTLTAGTWELLEDLDCSLYGRDDANLYGLRVGADNVTIEGNGFRLIAPDSSRAISSEGFRNVTVRNLTVDGWCNGVGIYIEGGAHGPADPGHVLDNIQAKGRSYGVHIRNTGKVQIRGLTTDSASTAGLYLQNITQSDASPLVLRDLHLEKSLVGLLVNGFNGQNATCSGNVRACNYTFHAGLPAGLTDVDNVNAAVIASIEDSDTGIHFSGNVTNATVLGRASGTQAVTFDGTTAGINANASTNANLTFKDLDVSTTYGTGTGLYVSGANVEVTNVVANRRAEGVYAAAATNLGVRKLAARGATARGLHLEAPAAPLVLDDLSLVDCATGLSISNFGPSPALQWAITPWIAGTGGTIRSLADSDTGISLSNVRDITVGVAPTNPSSPDYSLGLDSSSYGIDARSISNARLTFTNLDLSSAGATTGMGLRLGGSSHRAEHLVIARRATALSLSALSGSSSVFDDIDAHRNTVGLLVQSFTTAAHAVPTFSDIDLAGNTTALSISGWEKPWTITPALVGAWPANSAINVGGSDTAILVGTSKNIVFQDLVLDNPVYGIDAGTFNNESLTFESLDLSGHGLGTGLYLRGLNHIVRDVTTSYRRWGLWATRTRNLSLEGVPGGDKALVANHNEIGLTLYDHYVSYQTGPSQEPHLYDLDLGDNQVGLEITYWDLPYTLESQQALDLDGSPIGIRLANTSNLVIAGTPDAGGGCSATPWRLANSSVSVYFHSHNQNVTLRDLDLSGTGAGGGVAQHSPQYDLGGHLIECVTIRHRTAGISLRASNLTLRDVTATGNGLGVGLWLQSGDVPPTLENLDLARNTTGLRLDGFKGTVATPWVLGPYTAGAGAIASFAGCRTALELMNSSHVSVAKPAGAAARWAFSGVAYAIDAGNGNSNLTFEGLDLTGPGYGTGLVVGGANPKVLDVVASRRAVGVSLTFVTNPTVTGLTVEGASSAGLEITNSTAPFGLSGLALTHNRTGLSIASTSGSAAITTATFGPLPASLLGNATAISVTSSPSVTVAAGLAPAAPTPSAGCGQVITAPGTVALTGDLDCRGLAASAYAITVGADGVTIDGSACVGTLGRPCRITTTDATGALSIVNRDDVTVSSLELVGLRQNGVGVYVTGGSNVRVEGVTVRGYGTGVSAATTSNLRLSSVVATENEQAGVALASPGADLSLTGLTLTNNLSFGLDLSSLDALGPSGESLLTLGPSALTSVAGNGTSIRFSSVRGVTVSGTNALQPLLLDGRTEGLQAIVGTNEALTLRFLDASAAMGVAGTGVYLDGRGHTLTDLVANHRAIGVQLAGTASLGATPTSLTRVDARRCVSALMLDGFGTGHVWPTFANVQLGESSVALALSNWTFTASQPQTISPAQMAGLSVTGASTAISVRRSRYLVFEDLVLGNPIGVDAFEVNNNEPNPNAGLLFDNLELDGPGWGSGLQLQGPDHVIRDVRAYHHAHGVYAYRASNLRIERLTASSNVTAGLTMQSMSVNNAPPTLLALTLTHNKIGLSLTEWSRAFVLDGDPSLPLATRLFLDTTGSRTGVNVSGTTGADFTFRNLAFANPDVGLYSRVPKLRVEHVDASGTDTTVTTGTGLDVGGDDLGLSDVTADHRALGLDVSGSNTSTGLLSLEDVRSRHSTRGLRLSRIAAAPTLDGLTLQDNQFALTLFTWSASFTLDASHSLDVSGSATGLELQDPVGNLTVDGTGLVFDNPAYGIYVNSYSDTAPYTIRHVDVSGSGRGVGLSLTGRRWSATDVTANERATGVSAIVNPTATAGATSLTDIVASGASYAALAIDVPAADALVLDDLALTDSAVGIFVSRAVGPLTFDPSNIVPDASGRHLAGNLTAIQIISRVTDLTIADLVLSNPSAAIGGDSTGITNRRIRVDGVDATGSCRGTGIRLLGQDHLVTDTTIARRGLGLDLRSSDRVTVSDSVVSANVQGASVTGTSLVVNEVASAFTASTVTVSPTAIARLATGMTILVGGQSVVIGAIDTTNRIITFSPVLSPLPGSAPTVRTTDWDHTNTQRLIVTDTDLCANGRATSSRFALDGGADLVTAIDNYWRASNGPTHASNAPGTGDFVTVATTNATLTPFQTVPTDKANDYCNQAPVPEAGPAQEACAGDTVTLSGASSYDPDCGPDALSMVGCALSVVPEGVTDKEKFTYAWTTLPGTSVALSNTSTATPTFVAPTPPAGSNTTTLSFSLVVEDDLIPRTDTTSVLVRRRNLPPTAAAQGPTAVTEGTTGVPLTSTGSADAESLPLGYAWVQIGGPTVTLSNPSSASPTFDTPQVDADALVTFALTVTDAVPPEHCGGALIDTAAVSVLIRNQATGCPPEDPECQPCLDVPDGTVIATDEPCPAEVCEDPAVALTGDVVCQSGQPTSTCPADSLPDTSCSTNLTVSYAIVYDAAHKPRGTIRCAKDALDLVTCDELPGEPGVLRIYPDLWCTGVSP